MSLGESGSTGARMHVHFVDSIEHVPRISAALPQLLITHGPEATRVPVLVAGRPSESQLGACTGTLVIPYAGLPRRTARLLSGRPELRVFNLHHNAQAVAEGAMALLLAARKMVVPMDQSLRRHDWGPRYAPDPALPLAGSTAVVLGFGAIGQRIGAMLEGLGISVIPVRRGDPWPLDRAEILVCALPSTEETRGALDGEALERLPSSCTIVNVGRADLFDEQALFRALESRRVHSAGLDVWFNYPRTPETPTPPSAAPFESLDNVVMSPHRCGHGPQVEDARVQALIETLATLADGRTPPHEVDLARGY